MESPSRQHYLSQIKSYRPEIADFIARCERQQVAPVDRDALRKRAHDLALASDAQGYGLIGLRAQLLEDALQQRQADDTLARLAAALFEACHEALVFLPSMRGVEQPGHAPALGNHKPCLLTADDDRSVRAMVAAIFASDAHVISAADGEAALAAIRQHKPDLVLLDDMMPQMTGLRLLQVLQEDIELSVIRVVMLTSSDREQDRARALEAGAIDCIAKPFDPVKLVARLRPLLQARTSRIA